MKEALDAAASIIEDCQKLLVGHLDRSGRTPQRPSACFSPFSTDLGRENVLIAAAATSSVINAFDTKDAGLS